MEDDEGTLIEFLCFCWVTRELHVRESPLLQLLKQLLKCRSGFHLFNLEHFRWRIMLCELLCQFAAVFPQSEFIQLIFIKFLCKSLPVLLSILSFADRSPTLLFEFVGILLQTLHLPLSTVCHVSDRVDQLFRFFKFAGFNTQKACHRNERIEQI